jgi:2'-5' RNA ligase
MASEQLRLFVACELPDELRRALATVQDDLRRLGMERLRWVRPEGIHVTLKFLGAVDGGRVEELAAALRGAIAPFELKLRPAKVGGFGGTRLRVVWVGLESDVEGLAALAGRVESALEPLGFPRERRPFAPHLTVARVRDETPPQERRRLSELIERYELPPLPAVSLSRVSLMRSVLGPGGAAYHCLASFPEPPS